MNFIPDISDALRLQEIGQDNLKTLYDYALGAIHRAHTKFTSLDSKASQTIRIVAVVGSILLFILSSIELKNASIKVLLLVAITLFVAAILFCLLCLRVRSLIEPPTVERAIDWINEQKYKNPNFDMIAAIIVDLANTEKSYQGVYSRKYKLLITGQYFEIAAVILVLAISVISFIPL